MTPPPRKAPKFPLRLEQMAAPAAPRTLLRPQEPLQHAHTAAARRPAPAGLGMDSADVRRRMVARLAAGGLAHPALLDALASVPRHAFVDAALAAQAYEDTSLPIGHGQTISKPTVVARMIALLLQGETARVSGSLGRVLEVGTGCGYQAALLARLARHVVSVERLKPLHDRARVSLSAVGVAHVRLVYGDGVLGHPPNAPYDSIIAAAGGEALPPAWLAQLAPGGRLVAPLLQPGRSHQVLVVVDRNENGYAHSIHEAVHFVPLISGLTG